jgi:hypothetical protein
MLDNILIFVIFSFAYSLCLIAIAQDVSDGHIPRAWYKKIWHWYISLGLTWAFGLPLSFIILDIAGNPPDHFYTILALFLPLFGGILAASVGLYLGRRDSEDKPAAAK